MDMKRTESMYHALPSADALTGPRRTQTLTWNEELTQGWRFIDSSETLDSRVLRYLSYLNPTEHQLTAMSANIEDHVRKTVVQEENKLHHSVSSLNFVENGSAYAVDLGSKTIVAVKITKSGRDVHMEEKSVALVTAERDLTSPETTAFDLFDAIADCVAQLPLPERPSSGSVPIAFVCSFDVQIRSQSSMLLNRWSKGLQTGRETNDPVEGFDMAAMLDTALRRKSLPFRTEACLNDLVSAGVLGMTQLNDKSDNEVRYMMNLGTGFNIGAIVTTARVGPKGDCVDTRANRYKASIPRADFDLEVDWADGNINENPVEKMVAGKYLGEIARRVVLKIFNNRAPQLAWSRGSLPTEAAVRIATDTSEGFAVIREVISLLWNWNITKEEAKHIQTICESVFNRSASMVAAAICAVARATNGLIPALGGSIVAVSGGLYNSNTFYREMVRGKIDLILNPILSRLLILEPVKGGSAVGAALVLLQQK